MPAACALGMISGKIIFNFEIAERLRTLRYLIFTGGVKANGIGSACFLRKRRRCGEYPLSQNLTVLPAPPRGRLMEEPQSFPPPRKAVPLGKVAANAVSRRKGYLQLPSQAQSRKGYAHFPTKSGLTGGAKQCIVRKNGFTSCQTAANALFYNHSLPL